MWYLPKHTDTSRKRETFWRFWIVKIHLSVLNYTITQLLWWKYFNSDWSNYLIIRQRSTITNTYQDNMDLRSASQETTQCYRTEQRAQIWPSVLVPAFFSFCHTLDAAQLCLLWSFVTHQIHALTVTVTLIFKNGYKNITSLINTSQQKRTFGETAESSKLNPYKFYSSLYYSYLLVATTEIFLFLTFTNFYVTNTKYKNAYIFQHSTKLLLRLENKKDQETILCSKVTIHLHKTFILQNSISHSI